MRGVLCYQYAERQKGAQGLKKGGVLLWKYQPRESGIKLFFHHCNDRASMLAVCMTLKPIWLHSNRNVIHDRRMPTHTMKSDSLRCDDFKKSKISLFKLIAWAGIRELFLNFSDVSNIYLDRYNPFSSFEKLPYNSYWRESNPCSLLTKADH